MNNPTNDDVFLDFLEKIEKVRSEILDLELMVYHTINIYNLELQGEEESFLEVFKKVEEHLGSANSTLFDAITDEKLINYLEAKYRKNKE